MISYPERGGNGVNHNFTLLVGSPPPPLRKWPGRRRGSGSACSRSPASPATHGSRVCIRELRDICGSFRPAAALPALVFWPQPSAPIFPDFRHPLFRFTASSPPRSLNIPFVFVCFVCFVVQNLLIIFRRPETGVSEGEER